MAPAGAALARPRAQAKVTRPQAANPELDRVRPDSQLNSEITGKRALPAPAWRPRQRSHAEELGDLWAACGCCSEVGRLRAVLLVWPGEELARADPPDRYLMLEHVAVPVIQRQFEGIAQAYAESGVHSRGGRPRDQRLSDHLAQLRSPSRGRSQP